MLGQTANRKIFSIDQTVPSEKLLISEDYDLAQSLPEEVRRAVKAAHAYKLFFCFENFVRDFVLDVMSEKDPLDWWNKVPEDVRVEVNKLEETEEQKQWMALGSRSKLALTTLPQLLRIMDEKENWKTFFEVIVRDKSLIQEARHISHIRNTICHMTAVSDEEIERVKMVMRDWFRVVSP